MRRPFIITTGIVLLLFVLGLWVYLILYGTPKQTSEVFTNLGFLPKSEISESTVPLVKAQKEEGTRLALGGSNLQQLSTRSVAGFVFSSTTANLLRYVEQGTGHVYEINLDKGTEAQISLVTLPQTIEALFSPNAQTVVFISNKNNATHISVGTIPNQREEEIGLIKLPLNAENIAFKDEQTLYFTLSTQFKTLGYAYNLTTLVQSQLFAIDGGDMVIHWNGPEGAIYASPKPTEFLEGSLYVISQNKLTPVTPSELGLTAFVGDESIVTSHIVDGQYVSELLSDDTFSRQPMLLLKEKCVFEKSSLNSAWCAGPLERTKASYLEDWYKGTVTSADLIWFADMDTDESSVFADLSALSGRTIDVTGMSINSKETLLLFKNKIDQVLWLYRL